MNPPTAKENLIYLFPELSSQLSCFMSQQVQMGHMQVAASGSRVTRHHLSPGTLYDTGTVWNSVQYSFFNAVIIQGMHFSLC